MGSEVTDGASTLQGFLVPDSRLRDGENVAASGAATTDSSYTESQARPGLAVPDDAQALMVPYVAGGQSQDIEIDATAAGRSGRTAELRWYPSTAGALPRSWAPPNYVWEWDHLYWDGDAPDTFDAVTIPSTQKVVCCVQESAGINSYTWDPLTGLWGAAVATGIGIQGQVGLVVLPESERVLLISQYDTVYSDDAGATWAAWADLDDNLASQDHIYTAMVGGQVLLLGTDATGGGKVSQRASADLAGSWDDITADVTGILDEERAGLVANPVTGTAVFAYVRTTGLYVRRFNGAFESIEDLPEITVATIFATSWATISCDPSGVLYVFATDATGGFLAHRSRDDGLTWVSFATPAQTTIGNVDLPLQARVVAAAGGHLLVVYPDPQSLGGTPESVGSLRLGGWSDRVYGFGNSPDREAGRGSWDISWWPAAAPDAFGSAAVFAATGAGTAAFAAGRLDLATSSNTKYYTRTDAAPRINRSVLVQLAVASGGSMSTDDVAVSVVGSNALQEYAVTVRFSTTQFSVHDTYGSQVGVSTAVTLTGEHQFLIVMQSPTIYTYYRVAGEDAWTAGPTGTITLNTSAVPATGSTVWGNIASATATSDWGMVCIRVGAGIIGTTGAVGSPTATLPPGKPVSAAASPVPYVGSATAWGRLGAVRGPTRVGGAWSVAATADYPIESVHPGVTPSPRSGWRGAAGYAEAYVTWDLGQDTFLGRVIGLYLGHVNFRQAALEYYNGSTWVGLGTADLGLGHTALTGVLDGDILDVGASGTAGDRYLTVGEYVDGFVELGSSKTRRVAWSSQGLWAPSKTTVKPSFRLSDVDGTETQGSQTVGLTAHSGVLVVHAAEATRARYWRVRIPALQPCPDAEYRAGTIAVGAIRVLGQSDGWGWTRTTTGRYTQTESAAGVIRRREAGPARETWSRTWDPTDRTAELDGADADYVSVPSGEPLAAEGEVWSALRGMLRGHLASGAAPVVGLRVVPSTTTTVVDPQAFLYGHLDGSVQVDHVSGDVDGVDEIVRPGRITLTEVV